MDGVLWKSESMQGCDDNPGVCHAGCGLSLETFVVVTMGCEGVDASARLDF